MQDIYVRHRIKCKVRVIYMFCIEYKCKGRCSHNSHMYVMFVGHLILIYSHTNSRNSHIIHRYKYIWLNCKSILKVHINWNNTPYIFKIMTISICVKNYLPFLSSPTCDFWKTKDTIEKKTMIRAIGHDYCKDDRSSTFYCEP